MSLANTPAPIFVYNSALALQGVVSLYESASYTKSWWDCKGFSITINYNAPFATLLTVGAIIRFGADNTRGGIITDLKQTFTETGKGSQKIVASGFELKYIFKRRTIVPQQGLTSYDAVGAAETVLKNIAKFTATTSAYSPTAASDSNRSISILNIVATHGYGASTIVSQKYTNALDSMRQIAKNAGIGFSCNLNFSTTKIDLDCAIGTDRSQGQPIVAILSPDYGSLRSATITDSDINYKNFIYSLGKNGGVSATYIAGSVPTGIDRVETSANNTSLEFTADLTAKGQEVLNGQKYTATLDGEYLLSSPQQYGTDFFIGDIVTIKAMGRQLNVRITEVKETWGHNKYNIDLTFDSAYPTIQSSIASATATMQGQINQLGNRILYSANRLRSAGAALTTGTPANLASITIPAGTYSISGAIGFTPAATTNVSIYTSAISLTSATVPGGDTTANPYGTGEINLSFSQAASVPAASSAFTIPTYEYTFSTSVTLYLVGRCNFTVSTMTAHGFIQAVKL